MSGNAGTMRACFLDAVAASFPLERFDPGDRGRWDEALDRFRDIRTRASIWEGDSDE